MGDRDKHRAKAHAEVDRIFDEMVRDDLEWRGTLLAIVYSGSVRTREGTYDDGDGVAHVVIGRPAGNVLMLGAARILASEVERRILTFDRLDTEI